jgi:glutamyl-tRNA reductase
MFRDGVDMTYKEFFAKLRATDILPTTSQPTAGEFLATYEEALRTYEHVFSLHISGGMSGTVRAAEQAAEQFDNVYVYDIDDLNNVIETNLEERQREAELAEEIVVAEVAGFRRWLDSQQVTPTIVSLRRKCDEVRQAEVAQALSALGTADPKTRKVVESLASSILNKVLHSPIASLKRETDGRSPMEMVTAVREIFDLPEEEAERAPEAAERSPEQGGNVGGQ